jgi:hypothetical protein
LDKVFALNNLATLSTRVTVDYTKLVQEVVAEVEEKRWLSLMVSSTPDSYGFGPIQAAVTTSAAQLLQRDYRYWPAQVAQPAYQQNYTSIYKNQYLPL